MAISIARETRSSELRAVTFSARSPDPSLLVFVPSIIVAPGLRLSILSRRPLTSEATAQK